MFCWLVVDVFWVIFVGFVSGFGFSLQVFYLWFDGFLLGGGCLMVVFLAAVLGFAFQKPRKNKHNLKIRPSNSSK